MKKSLFISLSALLLSAVMLFGCSKQDPDAPNGYQKASNDNTTYTLFVPSDWVVDTAEQSVVVSARVSEQDSSNLTMMSYDATAEYLGQTDEEGKELSPVPLYWADYEAELAKSFDLDDEGKSTFKLETDGKTTLMGKTADGTNVPAFAYVYSGKIGGIELKYMQVIACYKDTFYFFTFTTPAERYDTHVEKVEEILTYVVFD